MMVVATDAPLDSRNLERLAALAPTPEILRELEFLGVEVDAAKNEAVQGEGSLHAASSRVHIYVLRTDEELVVARQTCEFLGL